MAYIFTVKEIDISNLNIKKFIKDNFNKDNLEEIIVKYNKTIDGFILYSNDKIMNNLLFQWSSVLKCYMSQRYYKYDQYVYSFIKIY